MKNKKAGEYYKKWSENCRIFIDYKPIHNHEDMLMFAENYHKFETEEENEKLKNIEWIDVEDRLPDNGQVIIIHQREYGVIDNCYFNESCKPSFMEKTLMVETAWVGVTHWMPLPKPPNQK